MVVKADRVPWGIRAVPHARTNIVLRSWELIQEENRHLHFEPKCSTRPLLLQPWTKLAKKRCMKSIDRQRSGASLSRKKESCNICSILRTHVKGWDSHPLVNQAPRGAFKANLPCWLNQTRPLATTREWNEVQTARYEVEMAVKATVITLIPAR